MEDRILKIAQQVMNGLPINAACTCGQEDRTAPDGGSALHAPDCAYERAIDSAWDYATSQAEQIVQDIELHDVA